MLCPSIVNCAVVLARCYGLLRNSARWRVGPQCGMLLLGVRSRAEDEENSEGSGARPPPLKDLTDSRCANTVQVRRIKHTQPQSGCSLCCFPFDVAVCATVRSRAVTGVTCGAVCCRNVMCCSGCCVGSRVSDAQASE
eukprot:1116304-Rhodomonas_salina.3